jgi:hypothetical protein
MLELRIATAHRIDASEARSVIAFHAAVVNAAESYPCKKSRRNSHGITSLQKTKGVGPVTTELTPGAEPAAAQPPIEPGDRDGAAIRIQNVARHYTRWVLIPMEYDNYGVARVKAETEMYRIADYSPCALVISILECRSSAFAEKT